MIEVHCDCGHFFEVQDSLAGGISNCPQCTKALEVPGHRDPFWAFLQAVAFFGWMAAMYIAYQTAGPGWAIVTGLIVGGILLLVRYVF